MKRFALYITLVFLAITTGFAQKSEYRYFSFRIGTVNNYYPSPDENSNLLMHTPYGDFYMTPVKYVNFTSGGEFDVLYHIDATTDRLGFVVGAGIKNYGLALNYVVKDFGFRVRDEYRTTTLVFPLYAKLGARDIYINQSYFTVGFKFAINLMAYNIQTGNWENSTYVRKLTTDEFRRQTTSFYLGFNYNIFYFDLEYQIRSLINKNYRTLTLDGLVLPYQNLDFQANIIWSAGIHIPLTRWITMRSWPAEKIRRFLSPVR